MEVQPPGFSTNYDSLIRCGLIYEPTKGRYRHTHCATEFRPGIQSEYRLRTCARCAAVKMAAEQAFQYAYEVPLSKQTKGMRNDQGRPLSAQPQAANLPGPPPGAPDLTKLLEGRRILKGTRRP